jgi:hypothetical protein
MFGSVASSLLRARSHAVHEGGSALVRPCKRVLAGQVPRKEGPVPPVAPREDPLSESPPRVYTRGALFGMVLISRRAEGASRRKSRPMCTRGTHFLTAVGQRGSSPPRTSPRVYTRGGLSVIEPVSRRSGLPSPSENPFRVYTRNGFSDIRAPLPRATTTTTGNPSTKNGVGDRLPGKPAPPRSAGHRAPILRAFLREKCHRGGSGTSPRSTRW